ncbi:MAG: hypothetical protein HY286_03520 [Planctomycetes bacterium]|nr:hypothetical protein [Planctomycetota bacterium]
MMYELSGRPRRLSRAQWFALCAFLATDMLFLLWFTWERYDGSDSGLDASAPDDATIGSLPGSRPNRASRKPAIARRPAPTSAKGNITKPLTITARFMASLRVPAANVQIDVRQWPPNAAPEEKRDARIATMTTGADGRALPRTLQIDPENPIQFVCKEYGVAAFLPGELARNSDRAELGDVELVKAAALNGHIRYTSGEPVVSGYVNAFSMEGGYGFSNIGADGQFEITNLPQGIISLIIVDGESAPDVEELQVGPSTGEQDLEFRITRGRAIKGKIYRSDGKSPGPFRVVGVTESGSVIGGGTRSDGSFIVRGMPLAGAGDVEIYNSSNCYIGGATHAPGDGPVSIRIADAPRKGKLTIRLVDDETGMPFESPVSIHLHRRRANDEIAAAESPRREAGGVDGAALPPAYLEKPEILDGGIVKFNYGKIGPGKYFASVESGGCIYVESAPFVATGTEDVGPVEVRIQKPCSIEGKCFIKDTELTTASGAFRPYAGRTVYITDISAPESKSRPLIYNSTDRDGHYHFESVRPGTYDVNVHMPNFGSTLEKKRVVLHSNERLKGFDIYLSN